jgi:tetratricopeptide (TPR) repeat protein
MHADEAGVGPWMVDPETLTLLRLDKAMRALDDDDPDLALVEAEELLATRPGHPEALGIVGRAALQIGDAAMARAALERLQAAGDVDAITSLLLSQARFGTADLEGAVEAARSATDAQPDMAAGWFQQALALDRLGRPGPAALAWQRAAALDAERFHLPVQVDDDLWAACLKTALAALPETVRPFYGEVPVVWGQYPAVADLLAEAPPLSPLLDAMYRGTPPMDPEDRQQQLPEQVTLFRGNLVLPSGDPTTLVHRIHAALVHEAHDWLGLVPAGEAGDPASD